MTNKKNWNSILEAFIPFSLLEIEDDSEFLEWCSIEGSERLNELSRQLRTFFNYKNAIIRIRFSGSQESGNSSKNDSIMRQEDELSTLFFQYTPLLDIIGADEGTIAEKIRCLMEKVRDQPKSLEKDQLKNIKKLGNDIWMRVHTLSTFELHYYPLLLHVVIKIARILCGAESEFFWPFSCFYEELKQNYSRLEEELSGLLHSNEKVQFEANKKKKRVKIV
jgi:hypothetical protein